MDTISTGIFIFDDVEVLDFAGPFEVFSRTRLEPGLESRRSSEHAPFRVFTVAPASEPIVATGGLRVIPDYGFNDRPPIDLFVVPGGFGTRPMLEDPAVLDWIRSTAAGTRITASVCTGSLLLARAGLLQGKRATTHWAALDGLQQIDPSIEVLREARFVDNDGGDEREGPRIVTSAGVSAGIDMAFGIVESLFGREVADETARYVDYPRAERV